MVKAMSSSPGQRDLKDMAIGFIRKQSTMTLATCKEDKPWAAPVYFVFFKSSFYFFSDPCCRHISESTENRRVSASIHGVASTWQEIRGLQMSGEIQRVGMGLESAEAIASLSSKIQLYKGLLFVRDRTESGRLFVSFSCQAL